MNNPPPPLMLSSDSSSEEEDEEIQTANFRASIRRQFTSGVRAKERSLGMKEGTLKVGCIFSDDEGDEPGY